jgi:hypothetical protein
MSLDAEQRPAAVELRLVFVGSRCNYPGIVEEGKKRKSEQDNCYRNHINVRVHQRCKVNTVSENQSIAPTHKDESLRNHFNSTPVRFSHGFRNLRIFTL